MVVVQSVLPDALSTNVVLFSMWLHAEHAGIRLDIEQLARVAALRRNIYVLLFRPHFYPILGQRS